MANWGHPNIGLIPSAQPHPNSIPTMGNDSRSIGFSNGSDENNIPPSGTTVCNNPLFPSVINNVSSIPGNANHHLSSESSPSKGHDVAATNIAATNVPPHYNNVDDDVLCTTNSCTF